jgi:hypothetical protein
MRMTEDGGGDLVLSDQDQFIRSQFEALYEFLEQLERLIQLDVVNFLDVKTAFGYYMEKAQKPALWHMDFLEKLGYPYAKQFVARFKRPDKVFNASRVPESPETPATEIQKSADTKLEVPLTE